MSILFVSFLTIFHFQTLTEVNPDHTEEFNPEHTAKINPQQTAEVKPEQTAEEELWQTWSELLRNWEETAKKSMRSIRQLARQGIPDPLRGMAWQLMSDSQDLDLKEQYPALITVWLCVKGCRFDFVYGVGGALCGCTWGWS